MKSSRLDCCQGRPHSSQGMKVRGVGAALGMFFFFCEFILGEILVMRVKFLRFYREVNSYSLIARFLLACLAAHCLLLYSLCTKNVRLTIVANIVKVLKF